jgi:drug/metabolite transporter (DMT)-like permease
MLFSTLSIAFFNGLGVACTLYASAAQRSTIDTSRTLTIWIISCLFLGEPFHPWAILGFFSLTFGTLLYNEIIIIPCFGFNKNTKIAIEKRKSEN